jgi:hypothetical protein
LRSITDRRIEFGLFDLIELGFFRSLFRGGGLGLGFRAGFLRLERSFVRLVFSASERFWRN